MDLSQGGQVFAAGPMASSLSAQFTEDSDNGWNCFTSFRPNMLTGDSNSSSSSGNPFAAAPIGQEVTSSSVSNKTTTPDFDTYCQQEDVEPPAPTLSSSSPFLGQQEKKQQQMSVAARTTNGAATDTAENTSGGEEDASKSLAKEMSQLSVKEINDVLEDIHGVHTFNKEEPKFIDDCLVRMKREIHDISGKEAYKRACFLAPKKVTSRDFCLMFLRATKFNIKNAAQMCVTHFEYKQKLFGAER